ncbi:MAG: metallophosphoesterase [Parabacteroides sp.]|nr:metallophosphoesterase [Parabacteroides sp.]
MIKKYTLLLFIALTSCDLIDYHPYDGRISDKEDTDINAKNILKIEETCTNKDTIRFVFTGDTQRWLDETEEFVKHVNRQKGIDFVIHGGDLTDFGIKKEYLWQNEILAKLKVPYVALIGNHDIIGNGDLVYESLYGNENFSFRAGGNSMSGGGIHFICLNTNALEYDYSTPVPNFSYIKNVLENKTDEKQRTVFVMHVAPGSEQFNNNVADIFQEKIKEFPSLLFCLNAHDHNFAARDLFNDGIIYYCCDNIAKRTYLLFTITPDNYSYEIIKF